MWNSNEHSASGSGAANEQLPHAPTLAEAIASLMNSGEEQARLLNMIVQNTSGHRGHHEVEPGVDYSKFLETRPPIFTKAEHPIEANEWLQTLEQKFRVIPQCTDSQKAEFAGMQLQEEPGGQAILPGNLLVMLSCGRNSRLLSVHISCRKV